MYSFLPQGAAAARRRERVRPRGCCEREMVRRELLDAPFAHWMRALIGRCLWGWLRCAQGIEKFNPFLKQAFPEAFVPLGSDPVFFDHIYYDLNGIIHRAMRHYTKDDDVIRALYRFIDSVTQKCVPTQTVYFALDGPGTSYATPAHRERVSVASCGCSSWHVSSTAGQADHATQAPSQAGTHLSNICVPSLAQTAPLTPNVGRALQAQRQATRKAGSDGSLRITPGTPFMRKVGDSLRFLACQRLMSRKYQGVRYVGVGRVPGVLVSDSPLRAVCGV